MVGGAKMAVARTAVNQGVAGLDESARTASLRREWTRGFTVMLILLLAAAVVTALGGRGLTSEMQTTAGQLQLESKTIAALRTELHEHEQLGHQLLNSEPVDRPAFVQQQQEISRLFDRAASVFPDNHGMRAIMTATQRSWQNGLMASGLWGDQVSALRGDHSAENVAFDTSNENTGELLNSLDVPSRAAMAQGLARGVDLQSKLIIGLTSLFLVALAVTVYFRRRMVKDLLTPVAAMHDGVSKLQHGDYDNRIKVARLDELGGLAQSFNLMAKALHSSN